MRQKKDLGKGVSSLSELAHTSVSELEVADAKITMVGSEIVSICLCGIKTREARFQIL